jgi:hypothetical protein
MSAARTTPRRLLLGALGGTVAAGAAAAAAETPRDPLPARAAVLPPGVEPRKETEAEKRAPRYRETEHVRAFYQTNRY